jgi:hypothetical protein
MQTIYNWRSFKDKTVFVNEDTHEVMARIHHGETYFSIMANGFSKEFTDMDHAKAWVASFFQENK